jgi:hypothetical protein
MMVSFSLKIKGSVRTFPKRSLNFNFNFLDICRFCIVKVSFEFITYELCFSSELLILTSDAITSQSLLLSLFDELSSIKVRTNFVLTSIRQVRTNFVR